jgi:hypothetical protein
LKGLAGVFFEKYAKKGDEKVKTGNNDPERA